MAKNLLLTISQLDNSNNAASKPRDDIEYFLRQNKFQIKNLHININSKFQKALYRYWKLDHNFKPYLIKHKPDNIFIQYPAYSRVLMDKVIDIIRQYLPSTNIFFIIHDVESLRMFKNKENYPATEIELFNTVDGLIVHNQNMKQWLIKYGVKVKIKLLQLFDYKSNIPTNDKPILNNSICFAGNLKKSQFINNLEQTNTTFHIFGNGLDVHNAKNIIYEGSKTPDKLPEFLNYSYGLIWDGNSIDTCSGEYGDYLKYNSPHKASLYLSSGLPLIVWEQSALASFVKENDLGITISSLKDLDRQLLVINHRQYLNMKQNVLKIADKLHNGYFIKTATKKIIAK